MMRKILMALAVCLAGAAQAAGAQVEYPPPDLTPYVRSVQQVLPDTTGNVSGIATAGQLNSVMVAADTIHVIAPASGQTVVPATNATVMFINNPVLLALLTVTMPANPVDGQRFLVATRSGVTLLGFTGGTIYGAAGTLAVSGYARFIYSASVGAWFRTG